MGKEERGGREEKEGEGEREREKEGERERENEGEGEREMYMYIQLFMSDFLNAFTYTSRHGDFTFGTNSLNIPPHVLKVTSHNHTH